MRANVKQRKISSETGTARDRVMPLGSYTAKMKTPFGVLGIRTTGEWLTDIEYLPRGVATLAPLDRLSGKVCRQIERYLDDPEYRFSLPFQYDGTPFQCKVWRQIHGIPSGSVVTYRHIARALGTAPRPVGGACGANRLPIVIPCHRVVAQHGLGGFNHSRGGYYLEVKRWLLRHERAVVDTA